MRIGVRENMGIVDKMALLVLRSSAHSVHNCTRSVRNCVRSALERTHSQSMVAKSEGL